MIVINSIGSTTFNDVATIYQHFACSTCPATVVFTDDELTVKLVFDKDTHTLTATVQETGEVQEWTDVRLYDELFRAIAELVSILYLL